MEELLIKALSIYGISVFLSRMRPFADRRFLGDPGYMGLILAFVLVGLVDFLLGTNILEALYRLFAVSALNVIITAFVALLWRLR